MIYNNLLAGAKYVSDIIADLIIIAVLVGLIWFGVAQAVPYIHDWETTGTAWNAPTPVVMKLAIPIGAALMLIQAIVNLIRRLRGEAVPAPAPTDTTHPLD